MSDPRVSPKAGHAAAPVPFRLRVGVLGAWPASFLDTARDESARSLPEELRGWLDSETRRALARLHRTPIEWIVVTGAGDATRLAVAEGLANQLDATVEFPAGGALEVLEVSDLLLLLSDPANEGEELLQNAAKRLGIPRMILSHSPPRAVREPASVTLDRNAARRLERFNAYTPGREDALSPIDAVRRDIFSPPSGDVPFPELPRESWQIVVDHLLPWYVRASRMAADQQALHRRAGTAVWTLFPIAVGAVALAVLVPPAARWAYGLEVALLSVIAGVVWWADHQRSHEVWIGARFLAERIRSAAFMLALGREPQAWTDPGGSTGRRPDRWAHMAFEELRRRLPPRNAWPRIEAGMARPFAQQIWLGGQIEYHRKAAASRRRISHNLERTGQAAFGLALIMALAHVAMSFGRTEAHRSALHDLLTFLALLLPAAGAALGGFRGHRDYSRLARRSDDAVLQFERLYVGLAAATTPRELEDRLREVEQAMLADARDWTSLMRVARVDLPG